MTLQKVMPKICRKHCFIQFKKLILSCTVPIKSEFYGGCGTFYCSPIKVVCCFYFKTVVITTLKHVHCDCNYLQTSNFDSHGIVKNSIFT